MLLALKILLIILVYKCFFISFAKSTRNENNFTKKGLLLFTLRNGKLNSAFTKPYAEKIMIVQEAQETPMHFHFHKQEDIINRAGGNLVIELFNSSEENELLQENDVTVSLDGMERQISPGEKVILTPGCSISLPQRVYHRFYGEEGKGTVLVGEVSMVNDDYQDNHLHERLKRFSNIIEDEPPYRLLVQDYAHL